MNSEEFFSQVQLHFNNELPFVVYRMPNSDSLKVVFQDNNNLYFTKDFTEQGFVFSPFDDAKDSVLIPFEDSEAITISQQSVIPAETGIHSNIHSFSTESNKNHINLVKKGVEAITNNEFKKVVLSRTEAIDISVDSNPISIFKKLLNNYASAFVYCWYHPKVGLWLGATPETLLKIVGNRFSIMALAGTQNYKGTLDVVWGNKEKEEQKIVTDFIVNNIKPLGKNIKVSNTETVKAGNLLHLKTIISARLQSNSNLKNIISVLHPTPAVCGFPKLEAKQFILKNENYNREFYTGFLGELNLETTKSSRSSKRNIENRAYAINRKSTQLYVNLRCMQLKDSKAIIYIGGGITESSNPKQEWEETVSKSLVIKNVL